jgi:hypothetical protein
MLVEVREGVAVAVSVAVDVDVPGRMTGSVEDSIGIEVVVGAGFGASVWVGGIYTRVFVGLLAGTAVLVMEKILVGGGDAKAVRVIVGNGVPVTKSAPGVRKTWSQLGWVRMEESTASMSPSGLCVRKSLSRSS